MKTVYIVVLTVWLISACSLFPAVSPQEADLFTGYDELVFGKVELAAGTQMPERDISLFKQMIAETALNQNLFQSADSSTKSAGEEPIAPEQIGQAEADPQTSTAADKKAKKLVTKILITSFRPVLPPQTLSRIASPGMISLTCSFLDGDTGQVIGQAEFGNISSQREGTLLDTTELMLNRASKDIVKYISQRKAQIDKAD